MHSTLLLLLLKLFKNPSVKLVKLDTCYNLKSLFETPHNLTMKRKSPIQ